MSAYLCWRKPIKFNLVNGLVLGCQEMAKKGELIIEIGRQDPSARPGGGHVVSSKLRKLLNGNKTGILKIRFRESIMLQPTVERQPWLHFRIDGELLQEIKDFFGPDVRIQLQFLQAGVALATNDKQMQWEQLGVPESVWQSSEMSLTTAGINAKQVAFCEGKIPLSDDWPLMMKIACEVNNFEFIFVGKMNLIVSVVPPGERSIDTVQINKRLLQEELRSDVEIIAGNGIGVKCHSAFLAVHSEVLTKMLASGLEESRTKMIAMPDVSENGVRAFLAYLYYKDLAKPLECCSVAIELFQLGHKYLIGGLEDAMKSILLEKPEIWFDPGPTIGLFFFAGKLDNHHDLQLKAISVLKIKSTEMLACQEYQRLFQVEDDDESDGVNGKERRAQLQLQAAKELFTAVMSPST